MNPRMSSLRGGLLSTAALALALLAAGAASAADISGAGATFPYPIYAKWADAYKKQTGIGMNYQSIGSGGGIKQIKARTVTFGASDMPLAAQELDAAGLMQFPTVMGGVVPVLNLAGIAPGEIALDGSTLAAIYLGDVARWDDARIRKLNPNAKLPSKAIAVVHRSDGSGTTFIFTTYLSQVSPAWKSKVGASTAVQWPVGLGSKGNEGVANQTAQTNGAIGYVESAYAKQNRLTWLKLVNQAGQAVAPGAESFKAAAANADWAGTPGFGVILTNEPGAKSWPIAGATFILVYRQPPDPVATATALKFFSWAYDHGDSMAEGLDYIPMPDTVVKLIRSAWQQHIKDGRGKAVYRP